MTDYDQIDYYLEPSIIDDPYPYYEHLRSHGPVHRLPHRNVVAVTGFQEALAVLADNETFSSLIAATGPFPPLPFEPEGDDISAQIEVHRPKMPSSGLFVAFAPEEHARARSLLMRLFTPSRLKANEANLWAISDKLIDAFADTGKVELLGDYGVKFAGLVIADLIGVPDEDRDWISEQFGANVSKKAKERGNQHNPLAFLNERFAAYIVERRREPQQDILSEFATAKYPDGSTPPVGELVGAATFLFAAGQDTTARLLGLAVQLIAEDADLQARLRADRSLIPDFIEEALRLDGAVKTAHRLVTKSTQLAGVDLPAGTTVAMPLGAINRDPRRFDAPGDFRLARPKAREHLAFGRGAHTCPGAPLARTETRVSIERLLDRLADIRPSEEHHGPAGARRFSHEASYILRGLQALHLEFTPAA